MHQQPLPSPDSNQSKGNEEEKSEKMMKIRKDELWGNTREDIEGKG